MFYMIRPCLLVSTAQVRLPGPRLPQQRLLQRLRQAGLVCGRGWRRAGQDKQQAVVLPRAHRRHTQVRLVVFFLMFCVVVHRHSD